MKSHRASFAARFSSALLTAGILVAVGWPAAAHAEPSDDAMVEMLTKLGLGDDGALSTAIAEAGRELCPKLVKPGAELATNASKMRGNSGLTPEITGMVTGFAIQLQCPALMAKIANGELPKMLTTPAKNDAPALPFLIPGGN